MSIASLLAELRRREVFRAAAWYAGVTAALIATLCHSAGSVAAAPVELLFLNGAVYTVDAQRARATAVGVSGERIVYVGDDASARELAGAQTRVVDLAGRMLLPGFQDSHAHPASAPNPANALDLHGLVKREQIFARIRDYAARHPDKPWIVGDGWDESAFLPSGRPTRQMLDALVADRPALLYDNAGHGAWVNTKALQLAGISAATPDPPNGHIEREASGEPAGMLHEDSAMTLVSALIPQPAPEEVVADLSVALAELSRQGITAVVDAMATPAYAQAYATLDRTGRLAQRTQLCLPHSPEQDDDAQLRDFVARRAALQGTRLRADCVKLFLDGAYGSHTLVLLEPYADEPERFGKGKLFIEQQRLEQLVMRLDAEGFTVHMHAQGDGAVRAGLDAIAAARKANGARVRRHTISHLCLIDDADKPRFRELGVVANMSPLWMLGDPWETVFAPRLFGPVRSQQIFETRDLLDAGVTVAWGSDWPVTGVSPLEGLETATTRRYPGGRDPHGAEDRPFLPAQAIRLDEAIVAYTRAGAYLLHEERQRGVLAPGMAADLVVLDRDLFAQPPLGIHAAQVDMTVIAGKVVFERPGT